MFIKIKITFLFSNFQFTDFRPREQKLEKDYKELMRNVLWFTRQKLVASMLVKKYSFKLKPDEMKKVASDAFQKVGEVLQKRRKTDFYETVSYFVGAEEDPALKDNSLKVKLEDNKKHYTKINDVIQKWVKYGKSKIIHL